MVSKLNAAWSNTTNRMVNHATIHLFEQYTSNIPKFYEATENFKLNENKKTRVRKNKPAIF
jgi:hypothetical protein